MAESGTYTPETIARRLKIAEAMLGDAPPVQHWAQGLNELAKGYVGGRIYKKGEEDETRARREAIAEAIGAFSGQGVGGAAPPPDMGPVPSPGPITSGPRPATAPPLTVATPPDDTPIVPKPVQTASVGPQATTGLNLEQPSYEAGGMPGPRPPQADITAAVRAKAGLPPVAALPPPQATPPVAPVTPPAPRVPPPPIPAPSDAPGPAAAGPDQRKIIAALLNPWTPPAMKTVLAGQLSHNQELKVVGDKLVRFDPRSGKYEVLPDIAANKPTWGVIGETPEGGKQYGFVDSSAKKVEPYNAPGGGQPSKITLPDGREIEVPKGQDPKKFREHVTIASADAMSGKLTEAQSKNQSFASRMELAEKNLKDTETQGLSLPGKMAEGSDKLIGSKTLGNYVQTKEYQSYQQAKSQFITAMLRQESGATIQPYEFERIDREMFPQPGDKPPQLKQKREARQAAIDAMKKGAGPAYETPVSAKAPTGGVADPLGIR